jgi:plasmid maintenance system antidote protein VapI
MRSLASGELFPWQVARGAGVPRSTLAAVVGGQREVTPSLARKLAAYYKTDPSPFRE